MVPITLPVSTLAVFIYLAPAAVIWLFVELGSRLTAQKAAAKTLTALRSTAILATVLFLCYFCEHIWPLTKSEKFTSRTMYWGSFIVFMLIGGITMTKTSKEEFLHRDQTEEWKGWMQFLFIQYHYWRMGGAYNDIRLYISCYLWMTGFGNFMFFYQKRDYSVLRVMQMIWRMNFFVFFLCLTMDNPYIVYYICPLHTFFFAVTYVTMVIWSEVNYRQYHCAVKLLVLAGLLYLIYDVIPGIFHPIFGWLGTEPTGASIGSHGVEWEWYFRSFLDHYSTLWGMIFAMNLPFVSEWLHKVETFSAEREWGCKLSVLAVLIVGCHFWWNLVHKREKFAYNAIHSYYVIVPILTYLLVRNICPLFRSYYSRSLAWFGTITLECYLLQYHIWLSANAVKLWTIIPNQWLINWIIASVIHIFCATQVFNATVDLRDVVLPNDSFKAMRNLALVMGGMLGCFGIATGLTQLNALHLIWVLPSVMFVQLAVIKMLTTSQGEAVEDQGAKKMQSPLQKLSKSPLVFFGAFLGFLVGTWFLLKFARHRIKESAILLGLSVADLTAMAQSQAFELAESFSSGKSTLFEIGSLAKWNHGLVCMAGVVACIGFFDPYFGLCRLSLLLWAPSGQKTISWEEAYTPLLTKIGVIKADAEQGGEPTEKTPLTSAQ